MYIFRFPRREDVWRGIEKEITLLPGLTDYLSVAVPRFVFVHRGSHVLENFVGYRKIDGQPISAETLSQSRVAQQVAAFLTALHAFPKQQAIARSVREYDPDAWREQFVDFYTWIQAHLLQHLTTEQKIWTIRLWESYLARADFLKFEPVLIHGDLGAEHILCADQPANLLGVIDWEDAAIGDPALDFTGLWVDCGETLTRQVAESYLGKIDPTFWERVRFYAAIIPYHIMRFGLHTQQATFFESGVSVLTSMIASPATLNLWQNNTKNPPNQESLCQN